MALINETIQNQIRQVFAGLQGPVKLLMFSQGSGRLPPDGVPTIECQMCSDTRLLIEEVAELSDKISVEVHDFVDDEELAKQYRVDKIPAIAILGEGDKDYGIRLYGIPSGYEFSSLIEDILLVSRGTHNLNPETMEALGRLNKPVHIQVYVTPT